MSRLPLERFELFRSSELDFVREQVGQVFRPHRLDLIGKNATLHARMHSHRLRDISVNYISYGAEVRVEPGELETFYVVQVPLSGKSLVRLGRRQAYSSPELATVVSPTEPLSQRLAADCEWLICRIERAALESRLSNTLGASLHQPLRFELGMEATRGFGLSWRTGFTALVGELDRPDSLISSPLAAQQFEEGLMAGLLLAQPNNYSEMLDGKEHAASSREVRIARDLMDSHPEWPHTTSSLARAAGISVRALQMSFRHHLATTPRAYLREVRLRRIHDELRSAEYGTTSVGAVCSRWGFAHVGRFAGVYRQRFGELPSQTLRR